MIPFLGKEHSLSLLVAVQAVTSGLIYIAYAGRPYRRAISTIALSCIVAGACLFMPRWDRNALARGRYHRFAEISDTLDSISYVQALFCGKQLLGEISKPSEILELSDGIGGFVAVGREIDSLGMTNIFLAVSGKTDASSRIDTYTQVLSGHVPMLIHPDATNVLIIGLASGITAGEILNYPVNRLDIAEISPEVIKASRFFSQWNNNVLGDPRSHIINQDARTHLALSDRMYDVISSEPSNPWMASIANLYSEEFIRSIRDHLNPGGIFVQWIHSYQIDWKSFSMVGRTIAHVFPNSFLFKTSTIGSDYLIVCFKDDKAMVDRSVMSSNLVHASKSRNMRMSTSDVLYPLIMAENLSEMFASAPLHTDNHPYLEYVSPLQLYKGGEDFSAKLLALRRLSDATLAAQADFTNVKKQLAFADFMASLNVTPFGLVDLSRASGEQTRQYRDIIAQYSLQNIPANYEMIKYPEDLALCLDLNERQIQQYLSVRHERKLSNREMAQAWRDLANIQMAKQDFTGAIASYQDSVKYGPESLGTLFNLGVAYERAGQYRDALATFSAFRARNPGSVSVLLRIGANQLRLDMQDAALDTFGRALVLDKSNATALVAAGAIYGTKGDFQRAVEYSRRAIEVSPDSVKAYQNLAIALLHLNRPEEAARVVDAGLAVDPQNQILRSLKTTITQTAGK